MKFKSISKIENLYLDFETTSGDPSKTSVNPWHNCQICGVCVTWDDNPEAYYLPIRHYIPEFGLHPDNLPVDEVKVYVLSLFAVAKNWVNHNVKYDAHVLANDFGFVVPREIKLIDTLTLAKIKDSDRTFSGGYDLGSLSKDWLFEDISQHEQALQQYLGRKNKDYGRIPPDVMSPYGKQDVLTTRKLYKYLLDTIHPECQQVAQTEVALTRVIFEEERAGMCVDVDEIKRAQAKTLWKLIRISRAITASLDCHIRPAVNEDCFDLLCNRYGLPVVEWTDTGNASFSKAALAKYLAMPNAPSGLVKLLLRYRKLDILNNLFLSRYQELQVDGKLHPDNNQCVTTARRSCKNPNAQQLNTAAKELIHPKPGYSFISIDYSQIEFRLICHYIGFEKAIRAYNENPDTDFHVWVAELCEIARKPAKSVNFAIAFGAGKAKTLLMLSTNPELVADLKQQANTLHTAGSARWLSYWDKVTIGKYETIKLKKRFIEKPTITEIFEGLAAERAELVFSRYHSELYMLKPFVRHVANVLRARGWIRNGYGRRRNMPKTRAFAGFNNLAQSTAADLQKERTVALWQRLRTIGPVADCIELIGSVHDSSLLQAPTPIARDPRFIRDIIGIMEHPQIELSVPIRCSYGISEKSWAEADSGENLLQYDLKDCEDFKWLLMKPK